MDKVVLKLYISGRMPRSEQAIRNLKQMCEKDLAGECKLEVIDVLKRPQLAERERILATPTLVKVFPPPERRLVGDVADCEKVLLDLDLREIR